SPSASAAFDAKVEKPSAPPPAATNSEAADGIVVVVPLMVLAERTLPAAASWSTVKVSVPPNVPEPAVTVAIVGSDDVAASARQSAGCESASDALLSAVMSVRMSPY